MAAWSGFTDDDIRKMRQLSSQSDDPKPAVNSSRRVAPAMQKQRKGNTMRSSISDINSESFATRQTTSGTIDQSMKLSPQEGPKRTNSAPGTNSYHETSTVKEIKQPPVGHTKSSASEKVENDHLDIANIVEGSNSVNDQQTQPECRDIKELDENQAMSIELNNMQKFQQRQKVIEEANKHKRALLSKAIIDRQKKAKAEAVKLIKVQQELNHLDTLLTADVNIIRDKIEVASLEYMDAQKRYEKSEKEFIAAKMDLFSKGDAKEHLTEHLYTIIHQNEVRKAKKLVELMEKLAMEVTPEEMELTIPAIPQLTNFTAVSTIHDPFHIKNIPTADKEEAKTANIETSSSGDSKKPETRYCLPNSSTTDVESSHTVTADSNIVVNNGKNIQEMNNTHVEMNSFIPVEQNVIVPLNQDIRDTGVQQNVTVPSNQEIRDADINQNQEILTKPATVVRSDSVEVSQTNFQSLIPNDAETETNTTVSADFNSSQEFKDGGDNTQTQETISLRTDKALSQSDSTVFSETSAPGSKGTVAQDSSLSVSSGNAWTLPFS